VRAPVQTVDLLPTLLDLAGLEVPPRLPGRSRAAELLTPAEAGAAAPAPPGDPVFAQIQEGRWAFAADLAQGRFKYVSRDDAPHRLFDLRADPSEQRDLLEARPEIAAALRERAEALGVTAGPVRAPEAVPSEIRARLREIGYVEEADAP
jgi:arylsulfatase A-like enzyme